MFRPIAVIALAPGVEFNLRQTRRSARRDGILLNVAEKQQTDSDDRMNCPWNTITAPLLEAEPTSFALPSFVR